MENFNEYTAWSIRFIRPDASFERSIAAVSEIVLEPRKIIPFAWSVSSGDWLLFDYRKTDTEPPILYIDHEMALVIEDAEQCASEENRPLEEVLEENLCALCDSFDLLHDALRLAEDEI